MSDLKRQKAIEKVNKLLRLSASNNEHEAALAATKAQELLAAHNLTEADCREREAIKNADFAVTAVGADPEAWIHLLAVSVAGAFDCRYFFNASSDGYAVFIGVGIDHDFANCAFAFLYGSIKRLADDFISRPNKQRLKEKKREKARLSYCLGVVRMISLKLAQQAAETPVTVTALVPAKQAVIARTMEPFQLSSQDVSCHIANGRAYRAGVRDGEQLKDELHQGGKMKEPII